MHIAFITALLLKDVIHSQLHEAITHRPLYNDTVNDANCISCITTRSKITRITSKPTSKTFRRCTLLPQHVPSSRVPFAGHPPPDPLPTHFVRQAQLSWRLLRRLAFVTVVSLKPDWRLLNGRSNRAATWAKTPRGNKTDLSKCETLQGAELD